MFNIKGENMKNSTVVLIVAAIIVVAVAAYGFASFTAPQADTASVEDASNYSQQVSQVSSSGNSGSSDQQNSAQDSGDVVSEEVKYNAQNAGGYYREVNYKDGGFRQYDTDTGELIGSSYDSDQDQIQNPYDEK